VRCRPDIEFSVPPEPFEGKGWRVPTFCNWYGFNDRFAFGELTAMRRYFMRLDRLDEYIDADGIFHPETFLGWAMQGIHAESTRAVFATVRPEGTRDEPAWHENAGDIR
jgi:hypothetical protein